MNVIPYVIYLPSMQVSYAIRALVRVLMHVARACRVTLLCLKAHSRAPKAATGASGRLPWALWVVLAGPISFWVPPGNETKMHKRGSRQ